MTKILATTKAPHLLSEFVENKTNSQRDIASITHGVHDVCLWRCSSCSFLWEARVQSRVRGTGCPRCRKKASAGFNDIATTHPHLVSEWSSKNDRSPEEFTAGSHYKAVWECEKGHEWETVVGSRTSGHGCSKCKRHGESKFEHHVSALLEKLSGLKSSVNNQVKLNGKNVVIDLHIEETNTYIDLDPFYWHADRQEGDQRKLDRCGSIDFFKVREQFLPKLEGNIIEVPGYSPLLFSQGICEKMGIPPEVLSGSAVKDTFLAVENKLRGR